MMTIFLGKADVSRGDLILVNPSHAMNDHVQKDQLISVGSDTSPILLKREAANMVAKAMGISDCKNGIVPVSGYRELQEQKRIYADSLREQGEDFTRKYVAIPGCSEHQTGLAIDLAEKKETIDFLCPDFPYTGLCGRFRDVSVQYGLIERYPAGKEHITQISHEPWHFRYVGCPHSELITENAFTLEEYIDYLKQFHYQGEHLYFRNHFGDYEIFYVPIQSEKKIAVELVGKVPYRISGNNEDGVVITMQRRQA